VSLVIKAIKLASSSFAIQALTILVSPIIARIYGPQILGEFSYIQSLAVLLVPLVGLSLHYKLYSVRDHLDRDIVTGIFFGLIMRSSLICLLAFLINLFFKNQIITIITIVFAWSILTASYEFSIVSANVRAYFDLGVLAALSLFCVTAILKIFGSYVSKDIDMLIGAQLVGFLVAISLINIRLILLGSKRFHLVEALNLVLKPNLSYLRGLKEFWWKKSGQLVLSRLGLVMPLLAITAQSGASYAGYYAISRALVMMPAGSIGKAATDVLSVYSRNESGDLIDLIGVTVKLFCVGIIPLLFAFMFGGDLLALLLGEKWSGIDWYVAPMSIWGFGVYLSGVSLASFNREGRHQAIFYFEQLHFFLRLVIVALFLAQVFDLESFVWGFALSGCSINLLIVWYVLINGKSDA